MKKLPLFLMLFIASSCSVFKTVGLNCGLTLSDGCVHEPHSCTEPPIKKLPLSAFGESSKFWTNGKRLQVFFLDGTSKQKEKVRKFMYDWNFSGVQITETTSKKSSDVRISFKYSGSWSYVGTDNKLIGKDQVTMNYGWIDDQTDDKEASRVVRHEFGHAIGLMHEHQHPKNGIKWNVNAVYKYYADNGWSKNDVDNNVLNKYSETTTNYDEFDKNSIMLYPIPSYLTLDGFSVGWNTEISKNDKKFIQKMYPLNCNQ